MRCCSANVHHAARHRFSRFILCSLLMSLGLPAAGCRRLRPIDTQPLDTSGMSYDAVQELKSLRISAPEVAEIAKARESGFPDADCIDAFKIFRGRQQPFNAGGAIA